MRRFSSGAAASQSKGLLRNVGIIAHVDAGKTSTVERMLHYAGVTPAIGEVDQGTTVMDFLKMERERGITIGSAAISFPWAGHTLNLIDTPGHVDFTVEVERAVRVLDGAVTIIDAVAGVQAQTETVWRQSTRYHVPSLVFANKFDREGAELATVCDSMRTRLGATPLVLQIPLGSGASFRGHIDLLTFSFVQWQAKGTGDKATSLAVTPDHPMHAEALQQRALLMDALAESDEKFFEHFCAVDGQSERVDTGVARGAICRLTRDRQVVPVLLGSALRNKGIQPLMDAVVAYLPSPLDVARLAEARRTQLPSAQDSRKKRRAAKKTQAAAGGEAQEQTGVKLYPKDDAPLVALAFKVVDAKQKGFVTYVKVYSGSLKRGEKLLNTSRGSAERALDIFRVDAEEMISVPRITAGNIGAVAGLKGTSTGDTLMSAQAREALVLPGVSLCQPVFFRAIDPESASDADKLEGALERLQIEDPSFRVSWDDTTKQTLISGMGELHLEIIYDRLVNHYDVKASIGPIMIAYTSVFTDVCENHKIEEFYLLKARQQGKGDSSASVELYVDVLDPDLAEKQECQVVVSDAFDPDDIDDEEARERLVHIVRQGVEAACNYGVLAGGIPVTNMDIRVGSLRCDGDSREGALRSAASGALRSFWANRRCVLLEPVMKMEAWMDADTVGTVLGDLSNSRRASVSSVEAPDGGVHRVLQATVPLSETLGYSGAFRSLTHGMGSYTLEFDAYRTVGRVEQDRVVAKLGGKQ